jgi:polygalacturonase
MSIGSQTMYGITNVLFKNNYVYGKTSGGTYSTNNNGINIKSDIDCGGNVTQVTYTNTCMKYVKHLLIFNSNYGSCSGNTGTPYFTDIIVNGVKATSSQSSAYSTFNGYSSSYPLGLYLANVSLDTTTQQNSQYASVGLENSNITPSGTGVSTYTVTNISGSVPTCSFAY